MSDERLKALIKVSKDICEMLVAMIENNKKIIAALDERLNEVVQ